MIFVYVAAEGDDIKVVRAEGASILLPEIIFSLYLLKPQEIICVFIKKKIGQIQFTNGERTETELGKKINRTTKNAFHSCVLQCGDKY